MGLDAAKRIPSSHDLSALSVQTFLDSAPMATVVLDIADNVVGLNSLAEALLGGVTPDVIGQKVGGAFGVFIERSRRQGLVNTRFEHYFGHAWYAVSVFSMQGFDKDENLQVVVATDITQSKNDEFSIRESEAQLEEATRIAQLGTYKLFWDTRAVRWSPHMYVLHGLAPDSQSNFKGEYLELVYPDDRPVFDRILEDQLSGKQLRAAEYRIIRKDGALRWMRLDGRVLFDVDGEPYASFGTCQDVTEVKQREQELKNLLRRNTILYEALDASPIGVAVVTAENNTLSFFYVNAEFENLTRHNTSSLSEHGFDALCAPEDVAEWEEVKKSLRSSAAGAFELNCARRDGSTFIAQVEVAPVRDHPGHDATVFVLNLRDITVDRQRADALLQTQKMEALGQLSGGVAHEINNLLQPILTLSELGAGLAEDEKGKIRKYFDVISSSGKKARDIVRQILTFARRDAPQLAAYSIMTLVDDALDLLQSSLPPGIDLERYLDVGESRAMVNPTQVSQVVLNLVKNAADSMDGKGVVTVSLQRDELNDHDASALALSPGVWVVLKVCDSGCGIDSYTQSRIFEPFFTTKMTGKGTGLGLSVAYSIATGWGGTLTIESEVDKGTTAMVYIPLVPEVAVTDA